MAFIGKKNTDTEEQLGAFPGYVRRPKPNTSGMTAQIFGEHGQDADIILALSLSKFQDIEVFVNVYLVKDSNGKLMKENNSYPLISSFSGFVRKSLPTKDGMIAQIFSPNGPDSDEISNLSKSTYQDALVFVDIRGNLAKNNKNHEENYQAINSSCTNKHTKSEKEAIIKDEKVFKKMNELLRFHEFLYKVEVVSSLGGSENFKEWLIKNQTCSHFQEQNCTNNSNIVEVDFLMRPINYMPICEEHKLSLSDSQHLKGSQTYYEMKHRILVKEWMWGILKEKFSFDGQSEPNPNKIIDWAINNKLFNYLPEKYQKTS